MRKYSFKISRKPNTTWLVVMVFSITLSNCSEIVEPDISKETLKIVSPTNNLQTNRLSHTFLWEELEGAENYHLQIASPTFDQIQQLVLNESIVEFQFDYTLSPGNYQWRIRAENNNSKTDYITYNLFIDSTLELTSSTVVLDMPINGYVTNNPKPTFSWFNIDIATNYTFYLRTPDFNGTDAINPTQLISNSYQLINDLPEGSYEWFVKAANEFSESNFSSPRSILIDITNPSTPSLNLPQNNTSLSDSTVTFNWNRPSDSGSIIMDSLCVFDNQTLVNSVIRATVSNPTYQSSLSPGNYYWYVRSKDAAGNLSERSEIFQFTIQ